MADLTGRVIDGKYRLVRKLGEGGMGAVYAGEHTRITRTVAVKMLTSKMSGNEVVAQRFIQEAQAASSIGHPNIIEIFDFGEEPDGTHYMVMELLEGESLADRIRRRGRLPPGQAVAFAIQLLEGLQAAHEKGIVHRDLKPDNLFLVPTESGGERLKILDFGISKVTAEIDGNLTRTGAVMGTPFYMSPEQARGAKEIDHRTDIWAAGVILYQMLSGTQPYHGQSYNEIISKILMEAVPPLGEVVTDLPPPLVELVEHTLVKDAALRCPDCLAFMEALRSVEAEVDKVDSARAAEGMMQTLAHTARPEIQDLGSAPTMDVPGGAQTPVATVLGAAPTWKRVLWYLLTLPLAWGMMPAAPELAETPDRWLFGVGDSLPPWLVYLLISSFCLGLTVAAVLTERMWLRRQFNRWLHGRGFLVFPVFGLLVTMRFHAVLGAQLDSALASFRAYLPIGPKQGQDIVGLLWSSLSNYLNTEALLLGLLSLLTVSILLGYVFATPSGQPDRSRSSSLRWLVLPVGAALVLLAEFVLFPELIPKLGPSRFVIYLVWVLTAIPVIRERRPAVRSYSLGWRAIFAGIVAAVAVGQLAGTVGLMATHLHIDSIPADQRADVAASSGQMIGQVMAIMQVLVVVLMGGLVAANWRWLGGPAAFGWKRSVKWAAWTTLTLVCMATPYLGMVLGNIKARNALMMPMGSPGIVGMWPGTVEGETEPSFYIDRQPASLGKNREQFFATLTGKSADEFSSQTLIETMVGGRECGELLMRSLERPEEGDSGVPAVCVSAIEARLYCEARKKRLPTLQEWSDSIGAFRPGEASPDSKLARGEFGEWTMKIVHGTATFEVAGLVAGDERLATLGPEAASPRIGFRCVFRFDD
jgi:eukaryotic-like serine/threonine-protein kinase